MDKFFRENIVIPKGENPHPYAGVLHQWVEGADIQYKGCHEDWLNKGQLDQQTEYRIKPSETVYEWQWIVIFHGQASFVNAGKFCSVGDISNYKNYNNYIKLEETKRVRK